MTRLGKNHDGALSNRFHFGPSHQLRAVVRVDTVGMRGGGGVELLNLNYLL